MFECQNHGLNHISRSLKTFCGIFMTNRKIISLSKCLLAEVNLNVPWIKHLLSPVAASLKSQPLITNVHWPIRAQYPGHVTCPYQSEASIQDVISAEQENEWWGLLSKWAPMTRLMSANESCSVPAGAPPCCIITHLRDSRRKYGRVKTNKNVSLEIKLCCWVDWIDFIDTCMHAIYKLS